MPSRPSTNPPLVAATGFPADRARVLARHGIITARDLVALAQLHECHQGLRKLLGVTEAELDALTLKARSGLPTTDADMAPAPVPLGRLGCVRDLEPRLQPPQHLDSLEKPWRRHVQQHGGLPASVNLTSRFQAVRDQGQRGTCVAHALVALREYLLAQPQDLSEQFLYWDCKQNDGHDGPGTYISAGVECLEQGGVCEESLWPYNPESTDDEGQGPPPDGCASKAHQFRLGTHVELDADVDDLKACLAYGDRGQGLPVVLGVPVFPSWGNAETTRTGKVFMPFDEEETLGGHALALAGYEDDPGAPGGGFFIFRNSWGPTWASESVVAPGYGLLPYAYVATHGRRCVTATNVTQELAAAGPVRQPREKTSWLPVALGLGLALLVFALDQHNGPRGKQWLLGRLALTAPDTQTAGAPASLSPFMAGLPLEPGPDQPADAVSQDSRERLRRILARLQAALRLLDKSESQ